MLKQYLTYFPLNVVYSIIILYFLSYEGSYIYVVRNGRTACYYVYIRSPQLTYYIRIWEALLDNTLRGKWKHMLNKNN